MPFAANFSCEKCLHRDNAYPAMLQNAVFQRAKDGLPRCKRPSFANKKWRTLKQGAPLCV